MCERYAYFDVHFDKAISSVGFCLFRYWFFPARALPLTRVPMQQEQRGQQQSALFVHGGFVEGTMSYRRFQFSRE